VVVWTATDPATTTEHARILVDYCERNGLEVAAFAAFAEAIDMLVDGLVDALVVATGADLRAVGIHVASGLARRPMRVAPVPSWPPSRQRRPRKGGAR